MIIIHPQGIAFVSYGAKSFRTFVAVFGVYFEIASFSV